MVSNKKASYSACLRVYKKFIKLLFTTVLNHVTLKGRILS